MAQKLLLGLNGSFASAIAAGLVVSQGHDVLAVHLTSIQEGKKSIAECQKNDLEQVTQFTKKLGISLEVISVYEEFEQKILDTAVHQRIMGVDENPCLNCKARIFIPKLLMLLEHFQCEKLVLGLFAQILKDPGEDRAHVLKAFEEELDQSYFLYAIPQKFLSKIMTPLGALSKARVEKLALELGLESNFKKKPRFCFNRSKWFQEYLKTQLPYRFRIKGVVREQEFMNAIGNVTGNHDGLALYVYGQEEGFPTFRDQGMCYVLGFEHKTNTLIIGKEVLLMKTQLSLTDVHFIKAISQLGMIDLDIFIDGQLKAVEGSVRFFENHMAVVYMKTPVRAVFPGNHVFLYDQKELIAEGKIEMLE